MQMHLCIWLRHIQPHTHTWLDFHLIFAHSFIYPGFSFYDGYFSCGYLFCDIFIGNAQVRTDSAFEIIAEHLNTNWLVSKSEIKKKYINVSFGDDHNESEMNNTDQ